MICRGGHCRAEQITLHFVAVELAKYLALPFRRFDWRNRDPTIVSFWNWNYLVEDSAVFPDKAMEPELKFRIAKGSIKRLANMRLPDARLGPRQSHKLTSTYFDTPKHKLRRHGLTLRIRRGDGEIRQTVKSAMSGGFARGEWEADLDRPKPDLRQTKHTPIAEIAGKKTQGRLKPVFTTSVRRITRLVQVGSSDIELAIDRGVLSAGRRSQPIAEVELELKKGSIADLFRLARNFERKAAAELDLRSKAERGYWLADGDFQGASRPEPVKLQSSLTASEAFNIIAMSTLRHFAGNADGIRAQDAEAIHQMRVGLRRLRAAISLFSKVLPRVSTGKIKRELRWLTNELAAAREIDVFIKEKIKPLVSGAAPERGARAIATELGARRKRAFGDAGNALQSARYRVLLLELLEWIEIRGKGGKPEADTRVDAFAQRLLKRRIRKARKSGKDLYGLTPRKRHKLRIRIKKIRYAVDFFRGLYPKHAQDELDALYDRLQKIQDALGALNDFVAHQKIATATALEAPRKNRRARAFTSGLIVGQEREASHTLIKVARKELAQLRPLKAKLA